VAIFDDSSGDLYDICGSNFTMLVDDELFPEDGDF